MKTDTPHRLDPPPLAGGNLTRCDEEVEVLRCRKPYRRFQAWKGRDFWHRKIEVQVRLEDDGSVFLSTCEGHVSTIKNATMTIEGFHALIKTITDPS